jgi:glycosyltransferase involved in cell wall biosynthesis
MATFAFVTPWFGANLTGGAERLLYETAHLLAKRGHAVHVLTTCCRSFFDDWETNHFSAGAEPDGSVTVRRFPVDRRDRAAFHAGNAALLEIPRNALRPGVAPIPAPAARNFVQENIHSSALYRHLRRKGHAYDAVVFCPYLYGTTLSGLHLVAERAVLLPCLHNEAYAFLPQVAELFRQAAQVAFNSEGELVLAAQLYGPGLLAKATVVGSGIHAPPSRPETLKAVGPVQLAKDRYLLYLGRRDPTKNTDLLVAAFRGFAAARRGAPLHLVLAGPGQSSYADPQHRIHDLGLIGEEDKQALLQHALALVQPSENESYSRVIMEAWRHGRPVLVHGECLATATGVFRCGGGLMAADETEWVERIAELGRADAEMLAQMGSRGRRYALEYADWDRAIDRLESVLLAARPRQRAPRRSPGARDDIHQIVAGFACGDAISNEALVIQALLRERGYRSEIFTRFLDPAAAEQAHIYRPGDLSRDAALIYHHSIGVDLAEVAAAHPGRKMLIYHNITPARFFAPADPDKARLMEEGRQQLRALAPHFPLSFGDSRFNALELEECGFLNPGVLPLPVDPAHFAAEPHPGVMRALQDGFTNILFVGRIAPNKRQDELVQAFVEYLTMDSRSRLILVGGFDEAEPYYRAVVDTIQQHGVSSRVLLPGKVDDRALAAFYRTAHLYWSMSEHEGFGVPLVEAMWYDVPVLAYKSTAVPETLGAAGTLFTSKEDHRQVAALAYLLVHERDLRHKVLAAQRERRAAFTRARFEAAFERPLGYLNALSLTARAPGPGSALRETFGIVPPD